MKNKATNKNLLHSIPKLGARAGLAAFGLLLLGAFAPRAFGWGITWSDEFTGASWGAQPWDGNWSFQQYTGGANGEIQTYVNSWANCHIVWDGTGTDSQALRFEAQTDTGNQYGHWYSARIHTNGKHSFGTGSYVEVRCKFPNSGKAYWPAAWCLGTSGGNWPANGEIDICEERNAQWEVLQTLHMPGWDPGTGPLWVDHSTTTYHNYGVWIQGDGSHITFNIDGNNTATFYRGTAGTWEFNPGRQFYILLNLAIGGPNCGFTGGGPDGSTRVNGDFFVDYVRQWN